jgi:microcystin-dependent protein
MDPYMASIMLFAGNFEPVSWAYCNGRLMSIAQNTALFSLIGTTYGGDGQVTFALPDLRGRVAVGAGQGPGRSNYDLGEMAGHENVMLLITQLPAHTHTAQVVPTVGTSNTNANADDPDASLLTITGSPFYASGVAPVGHLAGVTGNTTVQPTGGNAPFSPIAPYLTLNYIIATEGIFPSRN